MSSVKLVTVLLMLAGALELDATTLPFRRPNTASDFPPIYRTRRSKALGLRDWAGIGALALGGILLLAGNKR